MIKVQLVIFDRKLIKMEEKRVTKNGERGGMWNGERGEGVERGEKGGRRLKMIPLIDTLTKVCLLVSF